MTIKDLAQKTGYAVGTVSRALNNHPNVSEKAREEILRAAAQYGFRLNENAQRLKQTRSNTILGIVKGRRNELFAQMVEEIQRLVAGTPYQLSIDYMDEDDNEVQRALKLLPTQKPLGILFLGGSNPHFREAYAAVPVPGVVITNDTAGLAIGNLSSVTTDDVLAAEAAMDTLIEMGHREIAIIGGNRETSDASRLRYEGCMRSFQKHNLPFTLEKEYRGVRYSYENGYAAVKELVEKGCRFTAIFAMADVLAIGAIRALQDGGFRVPEDVTVMGVDGLTIGDFLVPRLATVRQSTQELSRRGVEILLSAIEKGSPACHETIPFQVAHQESIRNITI